MSVVTDHFSNRPLGKISPVHDLVQQLCYNYFNFQIFAL